MEELLRLAESGDGMSMCEVGVGYLMGKFGFDEDEKLAIQWLKKAHEAGDVYGTVMLGKCYLSGHGVPKCTKKAIMYTSMAAGQGSDLAAFSFGKALADGEFGVSVDEAEAIFWLEKAARGICEDAKEYAQDKLKELRARNNNE
eukprot:Sro963_g225290.1 Sel1 domain protein repeat-containing protein (144) ;mRNA; r:13133-13564